MIYSIQINALTILQGKEILDKNENLKNIQNSTSKDVRNKLYRNPVPS